MTRLVNPVPAPAVAVATVFAAKIRSEACVVVTGAVLLIAVVPVPVETTSSGLTRSRPLYSSTRTSANTAGILNFTVTELLLELAAAIFFA